MEKDYQSSGAACLCLGQKKIIWDHIHSRTAFVFVQNPARVRLFLLEVRCATKWFFKTLPAFNAWGLVGLFLVAAQAFRGQSSRVRMLNACIASEAGPSSTRMLSVHWQPARSAAPGAMQGTAGPSCPLGPRTGRAAVPSGAGRVPKSVAWIWGAALRKLVFQNSKASSLCSWSAGFLPSPHTCLSRQPDTRWATSRVSSAPSATCEGLKTTRQKKNTDDFYFTVSVKAWLKGWAGKRSGGNKPCLSR